MWTRRADHDREQLDAAMRELAASTPHDAPLPDPSFIWWKAQLLRRFDAEREATTPIEVGDRFHLGAAILGAVALAASGEEKASISLLTAAGMSRV